MKGELVHLHQRKRKNSNHKLKLIDKIVRITGIIIPLTAFPQLYNVWVLKDISGVSLFTWLSFFILTIPLLIYAFTHKEKPLITMYILWLAVHLSMVLGIFHNS